MFYGSFVCKSRCRSRRRPIRIHTYMYSPGQIVFSSGWVWNGDKATSFHQAQPISARATAVQQPNTILCASVIYSIVPIPPKTKWENRLTLTNISSQIWKSSGSRQIIPGLFFCQIPKGTSRSPLKSFLRSRKAFLFCVRSRDSCWEETIL